MATIPLVARRAFAYAGRTVLAGEAFVAQSAHDALLLKGIGNAIDAPAESEAEHVLPLAAGGTDDEMPISPTRKRRRKTPESDV